MAEKITIPSFRYGLDARRDQLVAQLGTLVECTNAFINDGGEAEKRQAFVDVFLNTSYDFSQTFGLLAVEGGFVTFADYDQNVTTAGANYPASDSITVGELSFGLSLYRCRHPSAQFGSPEFPRVSGVVWAVNFNGFPFACIKFDNNDCFLFYGGSTKPFYPVDSSAMGLVHFGLTTATDIATQLANYMTGLNGNGLPGWTIAANTNYVDVYSPVGVTGVAYVTETDDPTESISVQHKGDNFGGNAGIAATAGIQITSVGAVGDVWTAEVENGPSAGTYTQVGQYAVVTGDTVASVAQGLSDSINSTQSIQNVTSSWDINANILVYGEAGDVTFNNRNLRITSSGAGGSSPGTTTFGLALPSYVEGSRGAYNLPGSQTLVTSSKSTATPYGFGAGITYTYAWAYVSGSTTVTAVAPTSKTTAFHALVPLNETVVARFKCTITPSAGTAVVTGVVTIRLWAYPL